MSRFLTCMYSLVCTIFNVSMTFEWDEAKDRANLRKHGLDFESARLVFSDPLALLLPDPGPHGEERWRILGRIGEHLVAFVVFTNPGEDPEVYRIVSARRATANERKAYEES